MGGIKSKIPPISVLAIVVVRRDIGDFIERDVIVVIVVFEHIIAQIDINIIIVVIVQHHIICVAVFELFGFRILGISFDRPALASVQLNHFARVGADDRIFVQVVKALTSCWAYAFDAPLFFGHGCPFHISYLAGDLRHLP